MPEEERNVSTQEENINNGQVSTQQAQNSEAPEQQQRMGFFDLAKSLLLRALFIYFITSFLRRPATTPESGVPAKPAAFNLFENGTVMDLYVYISEKEVFKDFEERKDLLWEQRGLTYGDWESGDNNDGTYSMQTKIEASDHLKRNGSIYLHVYFVKRDHAQRKTKKDRFSGLHVAYGVKQLNKFKKLKFTKTQNLLTGETELTAEEIEDINNWREWRTCHQNDYTYGCCIHYRLSQLEISLSDFFDYETLKDECLNRDEF